jgi:hypothetical protein
MIHVAVHQVCRVKGGTQAKRDTAGSAAAPAARCRKFRRGSFTVEPPFTSFNHLVGAQQNRRRQRDTDQLRGLQIRHKLESRGPLCGQFGHFRA